MNLKAIEKAKCDNPMCGIEFPVEYGTRVEFEDTKGEEHFLCPKCAVLYVQMQYNESKEIYEKKIKEMSDIIEGLNAKVQKVLEEKKIRQRIIF